MRKAILVYWLFVACIAMDLIGFVLTGIWPLLVPVPFVAYVAHMINKEIHRRAGA